MQREKILALAIASAPILLTAAQWATIRIARQAPQKAKSGKRSAWTAGRLIAFAALIAVTLIAFPAALYALLVSLLVVPWPIAWPAAVALLLTCGVGIGAAFLLLSNSPTATRLIRLSGSINLAVLLWSSLQLSLLSSGPPDWFQPGIRYGAGRLEKRLLLNLHDIGNVTDIQYRDIRGTRTIELGIAGNYGARFFSQSLQLKASVDFDVPRPYPTYSVEIVPQSNSNPLMFYRHSSWSEYDSLLDARGKELWRTPHGCLAGALIALSDEAPGFLCVQSTPKCCTLEARNVERNVVWDIPIDWVFELTFLGPGAIPAIVIDQPGTGNSPTLMGLNLRGQPILDRQPVVSLLGGFSAIHWPGVCDQCLLVGGNREFYVAMPDGTKIVSRLAPAFYVSETRSVAVRLTTESRPMLAVIGQMENKILGKPTFHGVLFIFDSSGRQFYSEVFPEKAEAVAAMSVAGSDNDVLLVGGEGKIWEYTGRGW